MKEKMLRKDTEIVKKVWCRDEGDGVNLKYLSDKGREGVGKGKEKKLRGEWKNMGRGRIS